MLDRLDAFRERLKGTKLAGRDVVSVDVLGSDDDGGAAQVFVVPIGPHEVLQVWRAARSLVDDSGRWPVTVCSWGGGSSARERFGDCLDRIEYEWELAGASDPASIIERSRDVDLDAALAQLATSRPAPDVEPWDGMTIEDAKGELSSSFEPRDIPAAVMFLPDATPEHALAYLHWYAANNEVPTHVLIALLRTWRDQFDVELMAHWGTMLEFRVNRKPATHEEAERLALQTELVAPCTVDIPGISRDQHTAALLEIDHWFLHERP